LQHNEEKLDKDSNETRTLYMNQINEYKRRIEQLETDNEQLRREEIVHVEPPSPPTTDIQTITFNSEEREQLEQEINQLKETNNSNQQHIDDKQREYNHLKQQLTQEIEQHKHKYDDIQVNRIRFNLFSNIIRFFRLNINLMRMN
jgi:chromosome segregation ATPase